MKTPVSTAITPNCQPRISKGERQSILGARSVHFLEAKGESQKENGNSKNLFRFCCRESQKENGNPESCTAEPDHSEYQESQKENGNFCSLQNFPKLLTLYLKNLKRRTAIR
mgnify:CR=1 FL=1